MRDRPVPAEAPELSVVVTCYNEASLIESTLETVTQALAEAGRSYEIIVIDDVSRDDSVAVIERFIAAHPELPVRLHRNAVNRGLANNFVDGAFLARGEYYRLANGDNSEPRETLVRIYRCIGVADVVVPTHHQFAIRGKPLKRKLLSVAFTWAVNAVGGFDMGYYNGLALFRRHHVMRWPPLTYGFGFQADVLTRLLDEGVSYVQVPAAEIVEKKAEASSTAFTGRNVLSVLHTLLEIGLRRVRRALYRQHIPAPTEIPYDPSLDEASGRGVQHSARR